MNETMKTYKEAWRATFQWRTLREIGFDLLLFLAALILLFSASAFTSLFASPLLPTLQAINNLEQQGPTAAQRVALIQSYKPDINGIILKSVIAGILLYLLFILLYALLKTMTWNSVQKRPLLARYKERLLKSASLLLLLLLPLLLLLVNPLLAAYTFLAILCITLFLLPLLYAFSDIRSWLCKKLKRWWEWPLLILLVWLALASLFLLLFTINSLHTANWSVLRLALPGLLFLSALLGLLLFLVRFAWLHPFLLFLLYSALTWLLLSNVIALLPGTLLLFLLFFAWLLLFLAWNRHYLALVIKEVRR